MKSNGIRHTRSAPNHPATNGLAERFVQLFKGALKSARGEKLSKQVKLENFLLAYRNAPHATTGESPARLFCGRDLRTRLDIMRPDTQQVVMERQGKQRATHGKERNLDIGQKVVAHDYRGKDKWIAGEVTKKNGPLSYDIRTQEGGTWKRHIEQLRETMADEQTEESIMPTQRVPQFGEPAAVPVMEAQRETDMEMNNEQCVTVNESKLRRSKRIVKKPKRLITEMY
ncbi:uncharacterized protein K02A2.6-like [Anneissia japonica]|uniref:uncharacterized protein K02A2.6-like n=1 Tax=Anneissia japonica TaxID=1529436 RepID=UPI0014256BDD|nr:uncharacterized protein K02A2.6-like [Anneissia japonica]